MPVDVEVRHVAVQSFADQVRHVADREQVGRAVQGHAVFEATGAPRASTLSRIGSKRVFEIGCMNLRGIPDGEKDVAGPETEE